MSGETAGQLACIAWNEHYAEQHGIEARNEWAASDPRGRAAWEAAAATVETEQVRLARQDRDQLRRAARDLDAARERAEPGLAALRAECDQLHALLDAQLPLWRHYGTPAKEAGQRREQP